MRLKCVGTLAETRFRLSPKRTSPFKSAGASFQLTSGSRGVRINVSNAGYTTFRGSVRERTGYPLHSLVSPSLPSHASPCAFRFVSRSTLRAAHRTLDLSTGNLVGVQLYWDTEIRKDVDNKNKLRFSRNFGEFRMWTKKKPLMNVCLKTYITSILFAYCRTKICSRFWMYMQ